MRHLPASPHLGVVEVHVVARVVRPLEAHVAQHAGLVCLAVSAGPHNIVPDLAVSGRKLSGLNIPR